MVVAVVRVMPRDAPVPPGPPQRAGGVRGAAPAHAAGAARANLISLCPSCHRDVHSWPGWAGVAGLLLPAGADAAAVPVVLPGRGVVWLTRDGQAVPADGAGGAAGITEVC